MTKLITLLALLLNGTFALAAGGPLTEQQKKDFLEEFKSVERVERLFQEVKGSILPPQDQVYEKMRDLVQQGCKFIKNKTTKENVYTSTLESTEVGCPVVMREIDQSKDLGDGRFTAANKTVYQAGDLMKTVNDVIELYNMSHRNSQEIKTESGVSSVGENSSEGYVISQKNGRSDFTTYNEYNGYSTTEGNITSVNGKWMLNTKLGETEVEMEILYKLENGVYTEETILNGEKIEKK